jgi:YfiH family protein
MTAGSRREAFDVAPPPALRIAAWSDPAGLEYGFFGRRGGVSSGALGALNVSERVGDPPANVAANWRRAGSAAPGLTFVRMQQVHGTRVVQVESAGQQVGEADAMITGRRGLGLAVLTADCVPLLGVAPQAGAVMAVHAGWRGSLAGVAVAALTAAREAFGIAPAAWRIALGPSIGGCCYEVEAAIGAQFAARWGAMPDAWQPAGARGQLDLRRVNTAILVAQGVPAERITSIGPFTACASDDYFSHRSSAGGAGRQLSVIGLRPPG